jgi:spore coat protein U-like protein
MRIYLPLPSPFACLPALLLMLVCGHARADSCTGTLADVSFGVVSPISVTSPTTSSVGSVSCTWSLLSPTFPYVLLFPNVLVCVNAGLGTNSPSSTPRTMAASGSSTLIQYNLYRDATYAPASIWGAPSLTSTPTPISFTMTAPSILVGGTISQPFTVYAKIPSGSALASVQTVSNADTIYSSSFSGAATLTYAFYNLVVPACTTGASSAFAFTVNATATNNCTIGTTPLSFAPSGTLTAAVRGTSTLTVQCVNNDAFQIALNGGSTANNVAARQMKNTGTTEKVNYQLSATLDGPLWGDGTAGTTMYAGTGNGAAQTVTVYGRVPAQGTPSPGSYKDTVTATIYF